jgi:glycosidase
MDFVPNHLSDRHPYYQDVQRRGKASPYYDWFERDAQGKPAFYFDWKNLINLDFDNPEVRRYMLDAFAYWVREYKIDGFRVDVAWGVRERRPDFWPAWREELKRIDPDLLLLAEASARDPFYLANGYDTAYDWTMKLGEWAWQGVFDCKTCAPKLGRLREELLASVQNQEGASPFRFINNNDTGARFIARHGLEQTRLAAMMLFTLPGLPLIYNGDEVGAEFQPYAEGPPIDWRDRYGLTPFYTQLTQLRRHHSELREGAFTMRPTDQDDRVLAYSRGENILVLLNFSPQAVEVTVPGVAGGAETKWQDLLAPGEGVTLTATQPRISLRPFGARLLKR